jgi:hypothetical protein
MDFTQFQESPDLFHLWTGISVLSSAIGRRARIDRRHYQIYPNHYVILLASSAECRKSVACSIGQEILRKSKVVAISGEKITTASLLLQLNDIGKETGESELLIFADELRTFLSQEEATRGVIALLTRLYTSPAFFENRTKTAGIDSLVNCSLNMLAATTPSDFEEIIPGVATGSGFVPRLHIIHQEVARPRRAEIIKDEVLEKKLVEDLRHIHKAIRGQYRFAEEAWAWWKHWYEKVMKYPVQQQLHAFYARKHDYILKLGMVLAAAEGDELVLQVHHLQGALAFLDQVELFMLRAYEIVGTVPSLKYADAILGQIQRKKGQVKRSELINLNWRRLDAEGLDTVLRYLEQSGKIEDLPSPTGRGRIYKLRSERNGEGSGVVRPAYPLSGAAGAGDGIYPGLQTDEGDTRWGLSRLDGSEHVGEGSEQTPGRGDNPGELRGVEGEVAEAGEVGSAQSGDRVSEGESRRVD